MKSTILGVVAGVVIFLVFLWGGSWVVHVIPTYLELASIYTMIVGAMSGVVIVLFFIMRKP